MERGVRGKGKGSEGGKREGERGEVGGKGKGEGERGGAGGGVSTYHTGLLVEKHGQHFGDEAGQERVKWRGPVQELPQHVQ